MTLAVTAAGAAFDVATLRVRAGSAVTVVFTNNDAGVEHNLSFSIPQLPEGETCKGICTRTQMFTAPSAHKYSFFCTIHDMLGTLIVDP